MMWKGKGEWWGEYLLFEREREYERGFHLSAEVCGGFFPKKKKAVSVSI